VAVAIAMIVTVAGTMTTTVTDLALDRRNDLRRDPLKTLRRAGGSGARSAVFDTEALVSRLAVHRCVDGAEVHGMDACCDLEEV